MPAEINPLNQWPRVRRIKPGMLQVKGRYIPVPRWMVVRFTAALITQVLCLSLLAAALMPALYGSYEFVGANSWFGIWFEVLIQFRFLLRELLTEQFPAVGRAIFYSGLNPYDWHLLGIFIVMYRLRRFLAYGIANLMCLVLFPVLSTGFKVTFTRDAITVHRWFRSLRLLRHHRVGGDVAFRSVGPEFQTGWMALMIRMQVFRPGGEIDFTRAMVFAGLRPIAIAAPRQLLKTERITQSLTLASKYVASM